MVAQRRTDRGACQAIVGPGQVTCGATKLQGVWPASLVGGACHPGGWTASPGVASCAGGACGPGTAEGALANL